MPEQRSRSAQLLEPPSRLETVFITALVLLGLFYLSYRYPFKISASTTSATYSDTPRWLQLGKYFLFAGILGVYAFFQSARGHVAPLDWRSARDLFFGAFLFVYPLIVAATAGNLAIAETGIFFGLIPVVLALRAGRVGIFRLRRIILAFVYLAIAIEVVQVVLFVAVGRLPALAYGESLSVRFGSIWDDPNGWAVFTPFLMGFIATRPGGRVGKILIIGLLIVMLLFSQSLTGIGAATLGVGLTLGLLIGAQLRWRWLWSLLALLVFYVALISFIQMVLIRNEFFALFWETKLGSIRLHLRDLRDVADALPGELLGVAPQGEYGEPGYVNLARNVGVPYTLVFFAFGSAAIVRLVGLIVRYRTAPGMELLYGALFFLVTYYVAMLNLPVDTVFPLNLFAVLCMVFSYEELISVAPTTYASPPAAAHRATLSFETG